MKTYSHTDVSPAQFCRRKLFRNGLLLAGGIAFLPGAGFSSILKAPAAYKTKEEIFNQLDALVDKYFPVFRTCSQTSFYALNEVFDLKAEKIVRALAPFPGVAARGETCGTVTGSLLAIALIYEDENVFNDQKKLSMNPSVNFCSQFESTYGSTRCREVINHVTKRTYTISKPEDYKKPEADGAFKECPGVIKKAVHLAAELILAKNQP